MPETTISRFTGNLDPRAREFRPRNPTNPIQIPFLDLTPTQLFYPYTTPPPPPPQPPLYSPNDLQGAPFCEVSVAYPRQYPTHPVAYVSGQATTAVPQFPHASLAPTRTLVLSWVAGDVSESTVRRELEVYGAVRGVQMERVRDGIVTVHFYDLRHAERALKEIREQHMQQQTRLRNHYMALALQNSGSGTTTDTTIGDLNACAVPNPRARGLFAGRAVWAQFIIPASNAVPDGNNQGTLVVFNLDPAVTSSSLKEIFQPYGPVKELRETPFKKHQKFVEFYDIRDAAKALKEVNGKEIHGKQVVIEFSRPGGYGRKFFNANCTTPITSCTNNHPIFNPFHSTRHSRYPPPPPPPPPPLPRKFSGRSFSAGLSSRSYVTQIQPALKKLPNPSKANPAGNGSVNKASIEVPLMGSLLLDGSTEEKVACGAPRKNSKKSQTCQSSKQQQQCRTIRPWKSKQMKKFDARFLINEDAMVEANCKDSRTTVMIKNIPNKYSQKLLLNMLDNHCIHCNEQISGQGDNQPLSSYDFVYLPIDFNNKCNVGYGFVNMTSPEATWRLYKAFHLQHWEVFNSRKICEVTYARVQGLEALKEHFKNSKFPCEMEHYLPVVFSPPRDGRQLSEPLAIVGQKQQQQQHLHTVVNGLPSNPTDYDGVVEAVINENVSEEYGGSCNSTGSSVIEGDGDDEDGCSVVVA